jgi:TetR/AcrR family transcriptional regulator
VAQHAAVRRAGRREQRRRQRQDLSRGQLLDAAEDVFGRKGFHETTLKEIADLAEFSVGSVYSFFDGKDDLFLQVFLRRGDEFLPGMRNAIASGRTPLQQLRQLVEFEVGFYRRHPQFGRLYFRHASPTMLLSPERLADDALRDRYDASMRLQAELFERGQAAGQFREGDCEVMAHLLSGIISAYQSLDPPVVSGEPGERLALETLQEIVIGAFGA